jgi:hypothetical protein
MKSKLKSLNEISKSYEFPFYAVRIDTSYFNTRPEEIFSVLGRDVDSDFIVRSAGDRRAELTYTTPKDVCWKQPSKQLSKQMETDIALRKLSEQVCAMEDALPSSAEKVQKLSLRNKLKSLCWCMPDLDKIVDLGVVACFFGAFILIVVTIVKIFQGGLNG